MAGGDVVGQLGEQGRLADAGIATDQRQRARDDAAAMQYLIPGWSFDSKRPCLQRNP